MAGGDSLSRIVYRKDERGVILDSAVVVGDEDVPEGFEESAEYESLEFTSKEAAPVDESKLSQTKGGADLRQTIDVIKGDTQEGPSDPGGLSEVDEDDDDEDGSEEPDEPQVVEAATIDEAKDEAGTQEGPSDPGGEADADKADGSEGAPPQGGPGSGREAWAQYAASKNVEVADTDNRDDIVAAVKKAGHPV